MVGFAWMMTVLIDDPSVRVARAVSLKLFSVYDQKFWLHRWGRKVGKMVKEKGETLVALPWVRTVLFTEIPYGRRIGGEKVEEGRRPLEPVAVPIPVYAPS